MRPRFCLAWVGFLALVCTVTGQDKKPGDSKPGDSKPPAGGEQQQGFEPFQEGRLGDEKADKPSDAEAREFAKMVRGQQPASSPEAQKLLDKMSRWLLYRLTSLEVQEGREHGGIPKVLEDLFGDALKGSQGAFPRVSTIPAADADEELKRKQREQFVVELRKAMVPHVRKLLTRKDVMVRVNAARVLHKFAELGQDDVADDMIRILDNPNEHEGVRHWAIKGLHEVFAHHLAALNQSQAPPPRVQRIENGILAVVRWLTAHTQMPAAQVEEMSESQKNAVRFMRREAIHALTATHRPWAVEKSTANQVRREGPIAELFMQIMDAEEGKVSPEPSWEERVEAAFGLCQLEIRPGSNYQPDFAAQHMGRFVAAIGSAANDDKSRSGERWKFFATQLRSGSDTLKNTVEKVPANVQPADTTNYIKRAAAQMEPVFNNLYDVDKDPPAAQNLNNWLKDNPAKRQGVYGSPAPASGG